MADSDRDLDWCASSALTDLDWLSRSQEKMVIKCFKHMDSPGEDNIHREKKHPPKHNPAEHTQDKAALSAWSSSAKSAEHRQLSTNPLALAWPEPRIASQS